jgi:hypothetical protein
MLKDFLREIMVLIGWPQAERCTMPNRRDLGWSQQGLSDLKPWLWIQARQGRGINHDNHVTLGKIVPSSALLLTPDV